MSEQVDRGIILHRMADGEIQVQVSPQTLNGRQGMAFLALNTLVPSLLNNLSVLHRLPMRLAHLCGGREPNARHLAAHETNVQLAPRRTQPLPLLSKDGTQD